MGRKGGDGETRLFRPEIFIEQTLDQESSLGPSPRWARSPTIKGVGGQTHATREAVDQLAAWSVWRVRTW